MGISCQNALHIPRAVQFNEQIVPFWTGFYKHFSESCSEHRFVAYPLAIDAKPNDMATVFTAMMKQCSNMAKKVGQPFSVQTFDRPLYATAQQVKWSIPDEFSSNVIRLGGIHA